VTAVADRLQGEASPSQSRTTPLRLAGRWTPALVAALNAVAFLVVRPDVNDLWAARARTSAVEHGVGLTYWFSWFGGGSTPGNYSVITPYLSAVITTELLCALSAVAIPLLCMIALKGTAHPLAGTAVAAFTAGVNLWSGRVPFLFGAAVAIGALITLRHRKLVPTLVLTVTSVLASPVSGAFMAAGLSGVFVSYKEYRRIALAAIATVGVSLAVVAVVFGAPGPEPFSNALKVEAVSGLLLLLLARPPVYLRTTIWLSIIATFVVATFPNGMGSNWARIVWFCLPVVIVATSALRTWILVLLIVPLMVTGTSGTIVDLQNAAKPISTVAYYKPLAAQLDTLPDLKNYRVEVVNHGAHAAYDALLGHAALARGWETQEDNALNKAIQGGTLDATTYKVWLDNNAVGYVALPSTTVNTYAEYDLVASGSVSYLQPIWQTVDWQLFRVTNPVPIMASPGRMISASQSQVVVDIPCACALTLRVRWSKFLHGELRAANGDLTKISAKVVDDGSGWTKVSVKTPGVYVLHGSLSGGLLG
jgi:hypothetical protein